MSEFLLKENLVFNEKYYHTTLASGFKIIIVPKEIPTSVAFLCCDFGGSDISYTHQGVSYTLPCGTAHFLEHKMFETANGGDAFSDYDKYGGSANAFTSYENTCYYFSCTDNFFQNLNILLSAVSSLHCTEKSVNKERKIIGREITMYDDSPASVLNRNMLRAMYHKHPMRHSISGSLQDIKQITAETLYQAYNHFYVPSNMCLCVVGNQNPEQIAQYAKKYFGAPRGTRPITSYGNEPCAVAKGCITAKSVVATPLYSIGFKCAPYPKNNLEAQRKSTAMRLAVSLLFGRASDFYCQNYELGLINERFYAGFHSSPMSSYAVISGSGDCHNAILEKAIAEINYRKARFFDDNQVQREIKAAYAECITFFDNAEDLAAAMAANAFLDYDEYDCIELLRQITPKEIKEALCSIDTKNCSVSLVSFDERKK